MLVLKMTSSALMAALLFVVSPLAAAAAQHEVEAQSSVRTNANIDIGGGSAGVEAQTQVQAEARGNATSSDARDDEEEDTDEAEEENASGIRASIGGGTEVSVSAREIRQMSEEQKADFLATVKTHAQVQSKQDLENFAKGVLAADANVEAVESSEEEVRVKYRVPARFLGVFKASLPATVSVRSSAAAEADGKVRAGLPWYAFLFSTTDAFSSTSLESEVASDTDVSSSIESETRFSAQAQARVINAVRTLLETRVMAAMEAEASAEAEAETN